MRAITTGELIRYATRHVAGCEARLNGLVELRKCKMGAHFVGVAGPRLRVRNFTHYPLEAKFVPKLGQVQRSAEA